MSVSCLLSATAVLVLLVSIAPLSSAQTKASCQFHSLTAPSGYSFGMMTGINDYGTVVGSANKGSSPGLFIAATVYSSGGVSFYSVPNSYSTGFSQRNDSGINVGAYADFTVPQHNSHGIVLHGSTLVKVNYPGAFNTGLSGINKYGSIVGSGQTGANVQVGFKLVNGSFQKIAFPGFSTSTIPIAISDTGVIVGIYNVYSPQVHGFVDANGTYRKFDYPASNASTYLYGINSSGEIAGDYLLAGGSFAQGFIYKNGVFKTVNYPGATATQVWGLSNKGVVVGNWSNPYTTGAFTAVCQ